MHLVGHLAPAQTTALSQRPHCTTVIFAKAETGGVAVPAETALAHLTEDDRRYVVLGITAEEWKSKKQRKRP